MRKYRTVSVVFPTYNEGRFIAKSIQKAKKSRYVFEVIVVDGGSTDDTVEKAKKVGAKVIYQSSLKYPGKGVAMRDAISLASGEIIVFMDADILNFNTRMINKLVKPIIDGEADFVKGTFGRVAGRVTELVAKPLLRVFYPEYAVFRQPLSGEIAGKKEVFKAIKFEQDWGVDIGLLIDIARKGYRIKEVDIGYKRHDMKKLEELRTMARQVALAILKRAVRDRRFKKGLEKG
jgi:glycosyltransferase involved in cell wall biosynthesis